MRLRRSGFLYTVAQIEFDLVQRLKKEGKLEEFIDKLNRKE